MFTGEFKQLKIS